MAAGNSRLWHPPGLSAPNTQQLPARVPCNGGRCVPGRAAGTGRGISSSGLRPVKAAVSCSWALRLAPAGEDRRGSSPGLPPRGTLPVHRQCDRPGRRVLRSRRGSPAGGLLSCRWLPRRSSPRSAARYLGINEGALGNWGVPGTRGVLTGSGWLICGAVREMESCWLSGVALRGSVKPSHAVLAEVRRVVPGSCRVTGLVRYRQLVGGCACLRWRLPAAAGAGCQGIGCRLTGKRCQW